MKKIIKRILIGFIIVAVGALIIRAAISSDKSVFDEFKVTEASKAAYAENGSITVDTLKLKDKMAGSGYFSAYSLYYVEETGELQVTVRYNKSAAEYTHNDSDDGFEFLLLKRETPQDLDSSLVEEEENTFTLYDGEYFRADSVETKKRYGLYTYQKMIFKNVPLSGETFTDDELVVVMVPAGITLPTPEDDVLVRSEAYEKFYDWQVIHFASQPYQKHSLTRGQLSELKDEK